MKAPPSTQALSLNTFNKIIELKYPSNTSDFLFEFSDSKMIHVHKELLSLLSPAFRAMFTGYWLESTHTKITDASYDSFKQFIRYFYEGKIDLCSNNVHEIVNLVTKYIIDDAILLTGCESYMIQCITIENVIDYLNRAIMYNLHSLKGECIQYIIGNFIKFIDTTSSASIGHASLVAIVEELPIRIMKVHRERIYDFCIQWARNRCRANDVAASKMENVRERLDSVFDLICRTENDRNEFTKRFESGKNLCSVAASLPDDIPIFEPQPTSMGVHSISQWPVTRVRFRTMAPVKLLGICIAPIYLDQCGTRSTTYSGQVRLFGYDKEVASYRFNGDNDRVIFLNEHKQLGLLLNASVIYTLQIEITSRRGQHFEGYTHSEGKNGFEFIVFPYSGFMPFKGVAISNIYISDPCEKKNDWLSKMIK